MSIKTVLSWVALTFVVWWVIEDQTAAAHLVSNIGHFLASAANGLSNFFATL